MNDPLTLRRIECMGTPLEMGRAHGEELRELIRAFVAQRLDRLREYMAERGSSDIEGFMAAGRHCASIAEGWDPEGFLEHRGIAEAAHVSVSELYAVANMTDVRDIVLLPPPRDDEGCSAVLVPPALTQSGQVVAGQTWDLNPSDLDYVVALNRKPNEGPRTWSVTCVGCLSLVGMNEHGVGLGTTNIKLRGARPGVGYLTLLHRAIRARTRHEAVQIIEQAPRAAGHTYWVVDPGGGSELECSADRHVRRELGGQPLARTNHVFDDLLAGIEGEPPNDSSRRRLERLDGLLRARRHDIGSIREIFADRSDGVLSISRYPEDDQGTTTNACVVCEPEARRLWACQGPSERGRWFELGFD